MNKFTRIQQINMKSILLVQPQAPFGILQMKNKLSKSTNTEYLVAHYQYNIHIPCSFHNALATLHRQFTVRTIFNQHPIVGTYVLRCNPAGRCTTQTRECVSSFVYWFLHLFCNKCEKRNKKSTTHKSQQLVHLSTHQVVNDYWRIVDIPPRMRRQLL